MKIILALAFIVSTSALAEMAVPVKIFSKSELKAILGPYPARGSELERKDYDVLKKFQETRTEEECVEAQGEANSSLIAFFASSEGPLSKDELRAVTPYLLKTIAVTGTNVLVAKQIYKRPRPYDVFKDLGPCVRKESSYAYPSGHAATALALGHALVKRFPERADAIFARAKNIAWNRVLGGVHHPSDLEASERLINALLGSDKNLQ